MRLSRWMACGVLASVTVCGAAVHAQDDLHAQIKLHADEINEKVIAWRRDIHEHPELSNHEFETGRKVAEHLKSLGLEVQTGIAETGVVGVLRGGKPGKVVALRADMDALPVTEQVDLPFASKVRTTFNDQEVGVMHACGHDMHVAILMGAAEVLTKMKAQIEGTIVFIFQPAEEGTGGADVMVAEGALKDPDVEAIFGLHVTQGLGVGEFGTRAGGLMAGADTLEITIHGRQTHGAQPWAGVDPISVAAQVIVGLQTIVSRRSNLTLAPAVVTIATIHSGVRWNIIPDDAVMTGTIRTLDPEMQKDIHQKIRDTAEGIAKAQGATATVDIRIGAPITYNDPPLTRSMRSTLERIAGFEQVREMNPVTGAEDFSYYANEIPAMFFFMGVRPEDVPEEKAIPNHSPLFFSDESAIPIGVEAMAGLAVDYLSR